MTTLSIADAFASAANIILTIPGVVPTRSLEAAIAKSPRDNDRQLKIEIQHGGCCATVTLRISQELDVPAEKALSMSWEIGAAVVEWPAIRAGREKMGADLNDSLDTIDVMLTLAFEAVSIVAVKS